MCYLRELPGTPVIRTKGRERYELELVKLGKADHVRTCFVGFECLSRNGGHESIEESELFNLSPIPEELWGTFL